MPNKLDMQFQVWYSASTGRNNDLPPVIITLSLSIAELGIERAKELEKKILDHLEANKDRPEYKAALSKKWKREGMIGYSLSYRRLTELPQATTHQVSDDFVRSGGDRRRLGRGSRKRNN